MKLTSKQLKEMIKEILNETYSTARQRAGDYGGGVATVDAYLKSKSDKRQAARQDKHDRLQGQLASQAAAEKAHQDRMTARKNRDEREAKFAAAEKGDLQAAHKKAKRAWHSVLKAIGSDQTELADELADKMSKNIVKMSSKDYDHPVYKAYRKVANPDVSGDYNVTKEKAMALINAMKEAGVPPENLPQPKKGLGAKIKGFFGMGESLDLTTNELRKMIQEEMSAVMAERIEK